MTLMLEIADRKEAVLKAKAQARGLSAEQYASQVLDRDLEEERTAEPFWKAFTSQTEGLSDEAFAHLPTDGASEHDYYLYGSPKRNS
jgi:protein involved in polysaccharide export with SLBB domain